MPEISRFFGIIIAIYYNDHAPPHFHAKYGDEEATVRIATGEILNGSLSRRALQLVDEWRLLHRSELTVNWELARSRHPLNKIAPLE